MASDFDLDATSRCTWTIRMQFRRFFTVALLLASRASAEVVMVPHPYGDLAVDKTVVWSPLFQATWDKMNSHLGGPPEKVEPPDPTMALLDGTEWNADAVMPAGSWKTWAGPATPEFLKEVNREAAALNQKPDTFTLPSNLLPGAVASFGLLNRDVSFSKPLYRSKSSPLVFQAPDAKLDCHFFGTAGAMSAHYHEAIRVLSHDPATKASSLEVRLVNREGVILHLPPATPKGFVSAFEDIRKWRSSFAPGHSKDGALDDPFIHEKDEVRVPYLTFDARQDFPELGNALRYHPHKPQPFRLAHTQQLATFSLHEKGARVKVETSLSADPFGAPPPPPPPKVPRQFIFDRPFFVFLWKDGAEWPYFAAWIGDISALQKFN